MKNIFLLTLIFVSKSFAADCVKGITSYHDINEAYECIDSDLINISHHYVNFNGEKRLSKRRVIFQGQIVQFAA